MPPWLTTLLQVLKDYPQILQLLPEILELIKRIVDLFEQHPELAKAVGAFQRPPAPQ